MNTTTDASPKASNSKRGTFWALLPAGFLLASLSGLLAMASIAQRDPGFALEADYYERAVRWDRQQAQWAENARLGWHLTAEPRLVPEGVELRVVVTAGTGERLAAAAVNVEAFANARAGDVRRLSLEPAADGSYRARLGRARPGLWEFRFVVVHDGRRFAETLRADVPKGPVSP